MKETVKKLTCIVCGKKVGRVQRGLCEADYKKFRRVINAISGSEKEEYEEHLISEGKLLAKASNDVFAIELEKFRVAKAAGFLDANEISQDDTKKAAAMLEIAKAKSEKDKRESPSVN